MTIADNQVLLCPNHHREKTNGLLDKDVTLRASQEPYNIKHGTTSPYLLRFSGERYLISVGGNVGYCDENSLFNGFSALVVFREPLLKFRVEDGNLLLTIVLKDMSDNINLLIEDNQLIANTQLWDVEFAGHVLKIRAAPREILFRAEFIPPSEIHVTHGTFWSRGFPAYIEPNAITDKSNCSVSGMFAQNCQYGVLINSGDNFDVALCSLDN